MRRSAAGRLSKWAAQCSAVVPSVSAVFGSTRFASSVRTTSTFPSLTASTTGDAAPMESTDIASTTSVLGDHLETRERVEIQLASAVAEFVDGNARFIQQAHQ